MKTNCMKLISRPTKGHVGQARKAPISHLTWEPRTSGSAAFQETRVSSKLWDTVKKANSDPLPSSPGIHPAPETPRVFLPLTEAFGKNHIRLLPEDLQEKGKAALSDLHFIAAGISQYCSAGCWNKAASFQVPEVPAWRARGVHLEHLCLPGSTGTSWEQRCCGTDTVLQPGPSRWPAVSPYNVSFGVVFIVVGWFWPLIYFL